MTSSGLKRALPLIPHPSPFPSITTNQRPSQSNNSNKMKFSTSTLILLAATLAVAIEHKRYIVTYDEGTDDAVIEKAINDARAAVCF